MFFPAPDPSSGSYFPFNRLTLPARRANSIQITTLDSEYSENFQKERVNIVLQISHKKLKYLEFFLFCSLYHNFFSHSIYFNL